MAKPAIFGNPAEPVQFEKTRRDCQRDCLPLSKPCAATQTEGRSSHREPPRSVIYLADRNDTLALRYVLITSRSNHWDRVGNVSSYPYEMLRGAVMNPERLADRTQAIFVKVDKEMRTPEKSW